jgi:tripartite-type tricarboxylate transporter receptor subunit TctC
MKAACRSWFAACLLLAVGGLSAPQARAQDFPTKPVTLLLPLGAGGAMDTIARSIGPKLAERLGKPVVIENRTGGGTTIGAASVAKAAPDGHTILFAPSGTFSANVTLFKKLSYNPAEDFDYVFLSGKIPFVLVVSGALPVQTLADFIRLAKDKPLSFSSTGTGAVPHLCAELFKNATGTQLTHVPYRGSVPALADVVAGHVHMTFADPAIVPAMIAGGKVKALGVSSLTPIPILPEIRPLAEVGIPGYESVSWHMFAVPAGTPKAVVDRLYTELKAIFAEPEVKKQLATLGLIPVESPSPAELKVFVDGEIARWGKIIREVGIAGSE